MPPCVLDRIWKPIRDTGSLGSGDLLLAGKEPSPSASLALMAGVPIKASKRWASTLLHALLGICTDSAGPSSAVGILASITGNWKYPILTASFGGNPLAMKVPMSIIAALPWNRKGWAPSRSYDKALSIKYLLSINVFHAL